MEQLGIYIVTGYIPNDEDIIVNVIYKLQSLGSKNKRWVWVTISEGISHGWGTGTDDWGKGSIEDALIDMTNLLYPGEQFKVIKTNELDDVIKERDKIIIRLTKELENGKSISSKQGNL